MRRVVITGIGMITPHGIGVIENWKKFTMQESSIKSNSNLPKKGRGLKYYGLINNYSINDFMTKKRALEIDRFTQNAITASRLALWDSGIDLNSTKKHRFGVCLGTVFGGLNANGNSMREIGKKSNNGSSPAKKHAWIPTSTQNIICDEFGFRGPSKIVMSDISSGLVTVGIGSQSIEKGQIDCVLAGGAEEILTSRSISTCQSELIMSTDKFYKPFSISPTNVIPGEGSVMLLLEEEQHALHRGANIYCEISGFSTNQDSVTKESNVKSSIGLKKSIEQTLLSKLIKPKNINLVVPNALGIVSTDISENNVYENIFTHSISRPNIIIPKSLTGHMYGASGAADIAWAALSMNKKNYVNYVYKKDIDSKFSAIKKMINRKHSSFTNALICSRGSSGNNSSILLMKY